MDLKLINPQSHQKAVMHVLKPNKRTSLFLKKPKINQKSKRSTWGPAHVTSIGGWKYYISFCDDSVRYFIVILLQNKGEAAQRIKEHVTKIKQKFGKAPTYMRANNGKELINDKIIKFCKEEGITIEATAPYSPSQNGVAEQFN